MSRRFWTFFFWYYLTIRKQWCTNDITLFYQHVPSEHMHSQGDPMWPPPKCWPSLILVLIPAAQGTIGSISTRIRLRLNSGLKRQSFMLHYCTGLEQMLTANQHSIMNTHASLAVETGPAGFFFGGGGRADGPLQVHTHPTGGHRSPGAMHLGNCVDLVLFLGLWPSVLYEIEADSECWSDALPVDCVGWGRGGGGIPCGLAPLLYRLNLFILEFSFKTLWNKTSSKQIHSILSAAPKTHLLIVRNCTYLNVRIQATDSL